MFITASARLCWQLLAPGTIAIVRTLHAPRTCASAACTHALSAHAHIQRCTDQMLIESLPMACRPSRLHWKAGASAVQPAATAASVPWTHTPATAPGAASLPGYSAGSAVRGWAQQQGPLQGQALSRLLQVEHLPLRNACCCCDAALPAAVAPGRPAKVWLVAACSLAIHHACTGTALSPGDQPSNGSRPTAWCPCSAEKLQAACMHHHRKALPAAELVTDSTRAVLLPPLQAGRGGPPGWRTWQSQPWRCC